MNRVGQRASIVAEKWPVKHKSVKIHTHPLYGYAFPAKIDVPPTGLLVFDIMGHALLLLDIPGNI